MVAEMEEALQTLSSMSMLIPKLFREKVDKKRERIQTLIAEYRESIKPPEPKRYATLKECLRDLLFEENGDFDPRAITMAKNWPDVRDDDDEPEPVDMENYEFIELTDTKLRMCAGGDWQFETTIELELVDGQLRVTRTEDANEVGMSDDAFIERLKA